MNAQRSPDLFPRPPRRMRQPRKDVLRDQLALAATEIEALRSENERLRTPWWVRLAHRVMAALTSRSPNG